MTQDKKIKYAEREPGVAVMKAGESKEMIISSSMGGQS